MNWHDMNYDKPKQQTVTVEDVDRLTVRELRSELTARNLYANGLKRELQTRLKDFLNSKRDAPQWIRDLEVGSKVLVKHPKEWRESMVLKIKNTYIWTIDCEYSDYAHTKKIRYNKDMEMQMKPFQESSTEEKQDEEDKTVKKDLLKKKKKKSSPQKEKETIEKKSSEKKKKETPKKDQKKIQKAAIQWCDKEDKILLKMKKGGKTWKEICKELPGRSKNATQKRYSTLQEKIIEKDLQTKKKKKANPVKKEKIIENDPVAKIEKKSSPIKEKESSKKKGKTDNEKLVSKTKKKKRATRKKKITEKKKKKSPKKDTPMKTVAKKKKKKEKKNKKKSSPVQTNIKSKKKKKRRSASPLLKVT